MTPEDLQRANAEARITWDQNAAFWDERMGKSNDFVEVLTWPATERLLELRSGERVLDIACGNGLSSRCMAVMGAEVVAFDFSAETIVHARQRTTEHVERIAYRVLDATNETALMALGEGQFDAVICNMALFDMAEIEPLMSAPTRLLRPGGRFIFSMIHPCFNNPHMVHVGEKKDWEGDIRTVYSVKYPNTSSTTLTQGLTIRGQPTPQPLFHRPLQVLFETDFKAGFVLDGLEEWAFPSNHAPGGNPLSWGANFSDIPPVLVARMRLYR